MKATLVLFLTLLTSLAIAQKSHLNAKKNLFLEGYDIVSYFEDGPVKGSEDFEYGYQGATFRFKSKKNLESFMTDPQKYLPAYGGYCAYAIAVSGKKVKVDPETFEIRQGRLFLFYNFGKNNTLESWSKENPEVLIPKADKNWSKVIAK